MLAANHQRHSTAEADGNHLFCRCLVLKPEEILRFSLMVTWIYICIQFHGYLYITHTTIVLKILQSSLNGGLTDRQTSLGSWALGFSVMYYVRKRAIYGIWALGFVANDVIGSLSQLQSQAIRQQQQQMISYHRLQCRVYELLPCLCIKTHNSCGLFQGTFLRLFSFLSII